MTKEELDKFIIENEKLVAYTCWKHFRYFMLLDDCKYQEDIIAEGMIHLIKAAQRYDSSRAKFSTYAIQYIRGRLHRYFGSKKVRDDFGDKQIFSLNAHANNCSNEKDIEFLDNVIDLTEDFKNIELINFIKTCEIDGVQEIVYYLSKGYSQKEIASRTGKSQPHISNKINQLRQEIKHKYLRIS